MRRPELSPKRLALGLTAGLVACHVLAAMSGGGSLDNFGAFAVDLSAGMLKTAPLVAILAGAWILYERVRRRA